MYSKSVILPLSNSLDSSSDDSQKLELDGLDDDDPFSLIGPSITLLGMAIALLSTGIPLAVVFSERPFMDRESSSPTALESDGSNPSLPISFKRVGKPGS